MAKIIYDLRTVSVSKGPINTPQNASFDAPFEESKVKLDKQEVKSCKTASLTQK